MALLLQDLKDVAGQVDAGVVPVAEQAAGQVVDGIDHRGGVGKDTLFDTDHLVTDFQCQRVRHLLACTKKHHLNAVGMGVAAKAADQRVVLQLLVQAAATERIYSLVKVMGEGPAFAYQKKLNGNIQMYTKSGAGGAMPIATGQCGSGIFYIVDALDIQQQGYPVVITYPKDGVSYGIEATGIVKGAKNMDAAKKFVDWATSKKFADFIVAYKINYVPTRSDVKTSNPLLDLSKINMKDVDVAWKGEKRKEYTNRWINEVIK